LIGTAGWGLRQSGASARTGIFGFESIGITRAGSPPLFFHSLGPILYPMGARFPTWVSASGGIYVHKDREVPDTYATMIEYPRLHFQEQVPEILVAASAT
jgi:hypothetical protein